MGSLLLLGSLVLIGSWVLIGSLVLIRSWVLTGFWVLIRSWVLIGSWVLIWSWVLGPLRVLGPAFPVCQNRMSILYFNEEGDYSEQNTFDNEVFRSTILHHRKKLNIFTPQMPIYYMITYSIRIGTVDWCKCQKQPLEVFCENRCSLKFRKIHRKHLCQRNHLWTLQNFFT